MNFLKMVNGRWSGEDMKNWPSIRKTAYFLLPLLMYLVVHDIAEILLLAGMELLVSHAGTSMLGFIERNSYTIQGILNALSIVIGVAVIWPAATGEIQEEEKAVFQKREKVLLYIFLAVLAVAAALGFNALFGYFGWTAGSEGFSQAAASQYGVNFWIGLILYGIFSPFAEEAVFRGVIYNRMKRCFSPAVGLIFSSLLFGLYHGNFVQASYGILLGLLIACVYEKYQSFVAPMLFHSIANVSIFALTYGNRFAGMSKNTTLQVAIISLLIGVIVSIVIIRRIKMVEKSK